MTDKERLVKFELLGQEYAFYSAASDEEMKSILALVRQLVENGSAHSTGTLPVGKIAIMSCLNIASRYVKLKQEFKEYKDDSEKRIANLSDEIRARLLVE